MVLFFWWISDRRRIFACVIRWVNCLRELDAMLQLSRSDKPGETKNKCTRKHNFSFCAIVEKIIIKHTYSVLRFRIHARSLVHNLYRIAVYPGSPLVYFVANYSRTEVPRGTKNIVFSTPDRSVPTFDGVHTNSSDL